MGLSRINNSRDEGVRAFTFEELLEIACVIIRRTGLPTFPENSNPFESERSEDDLMGFALGDHILVVGSGPRAVNDRLSGPFHESLAQELRGLPAPVSPKLMSAFFPHRGHPGELLQTGRIRMDGAKGAKSRAQTRGQGRASSGQMAEQVHLGMLGEGLFDLGIQFGNVTVKNLPLIQQEAQLQNRYLQGGLVGG